MEFCLIMNRHDEGLILLLIFNKLGMDYKDFVVQNPIYMRPEELKYLRGDSSKAREVLGWEPEYDFESLMDDMIDYWMKKL